ncbi:LGFP repeat-containing protein [Rhodococcus sp. NPDC003382]
MNVTTLPASGSSARRRIAGGVAAAGLAVLCLVGGGTSVAGAQQAASCQSYWPSPYQVCDEIKDLYASLGGPAGALGFPTSAQQPFGVDGLRQTFTGGVIVWTPATGAYVE